MKSILLILAFGVLAIQIGFGAPLTDGEHQGSLDELGKQTVSIINEGATDKLKALYLTDKQIYEITKDAGIEIVSYSDERKKARFAKILRSAVRRMRESSGQREVAFDHLELSSLSEKIGEVAIVKKMIVVHVKERDNPSKIYKWIFREAVKYKEKWYWSEYVPFFPFSKSSAK